MNIDMDFPEPYLELLDWFFGIGAVALLIIEGTDS